jgi:bifunctional NMN adenylyltransferase/nudix hydrolase
MSDKRYDYAVFIGRFQPLHLGHEAIIRKAFEISDHVLIVVGSSTASRSLRNPFSFEERRAMIELAIEDMTKLPRKWLPATILPLADSVYNFHDWLVRVKTLINTIANNLSFPHTNPPRIALLGHYKDDTSYYLNYFPEYDFIPVDTLEGGIGATKIRDQFLDQNGTGLLTKYCSSSVREYVLSWMESPAATQLVEEYSFIKTYKNRWSTAPFPPTFVTTDAVVVALGHVLVIKRGRHPGKGLYALPGGFLDQMETIQNGCIRELKEETNIDTSKRILENSIRDEHVFDHPLRDPRGRTITHAFLFDLKDAKNLEFYNVQANDDASEVLWMPINEVQDNEDTFFGDHAQMIRFFLNRAR